MAEHLEKDILNDEARYTNPAKHNTQKKPRIDLSLGRADWVVGCSATAPRRDTLGDKPASSDRARAGSQPGYRGHSSKGRSLRGSTLSLKRGPTASFRGTHGRGVGDGEAGEVSKTLPWLVMSSWFHFQLPIVSPSSMPNLYIYIVFQCYVNIENK
jgi:hypothetical protein